MNGEHRLQQRWGEIAHWKDNVACGHLDEWTHVEFFVTPNNHGVSDFRFERSDLTLVDATTRALNKAFENGKRARSREFKALIDQTGFGV